LLDEVEDAALLLDASRHNFPIVCASAGFHKLTGFTREDVLGRSPDVMLEKVPAIAVSRSGQKNFQDYCRMCSDVRVESISETTVVQQNARKDGSQFTNFSLLGLCEVRGQSYILVVHRLLGEGLSTQVSRARMAETLEESRVAFNQIRSHIHAKSRPHLDAEAFVSNGSEGGAARPPPPMPRGRLERSRGHRRTNAFSRRHLGLPDFAFFAERLQDHAILKNEGYTVERREPEELPTGSLVFGDSPVPHSPEGLGFQVFVDRTTPKFSGLPLLGFTRRRPEDQPDLYPELSRCLGQSVLVGATGEAFARRQYAHLQMGFKKPPQEELRTWALDKGQGKTPQLRAGDTIVCRYTKEARLQLCLNGEKVLDFDVEQPPDDKVDYYAVVDVCFSACCLSLVPSSGSRGSEARAASSRVPLDQLPPLEPILSMDNLPAMGSAVSSLDELPSMGSVSSSASLFPDEPLPTEVFAPKGDRALFAKYTSLLGVVPLRFLQCVRSG
jgi:hypothetical protein